MITQEIITYALGISALISIGATVYNSLKNPQEKSDILDAILNEKFKNLQATVVNLRDNHIHTLESKLDSHIQENQLKYLQDAKWQGRVEVLLENIVKK